MLKINYTKYNHSSIRIPKELKEYKQEISDLFKLTCRHFNLAYLQVRFDFICDFRTQKAASVIKDNDGVYLITFNMALIKNRRELARSWMHEFRHVQQMLVCDFLWIGEWAFFRGETYSKTYIKKNYRILPWEKEARAAEKDYRLLMDHLLDKEFMQRMYSIAFNKSKNLYFISQKA